jgi:hypothetical protein
MIAAVRSHVVIRRPMFVAGTTKRPEVGVFTQAHGGRRPVPWGQIDVGETVWMKWSGGPIVAKARVSSFSCIESCTAHDLRRAVEGHRLHEVTAYWKTLMQRGTFFGMAVFLEDEEWLRQARIPSARSRSESWIVLATAEARRDWLGTVADETVEQGSRTVPEGLRFTVLKRDGFACVYCGGRACDGVRLQVDHVVPWSQGGRTVLANLRSACGPCNRGKGAARIA